MGGAARTFAAVLHVVVLVPGIQGLASPSAQATKSRLIDAFRAKADSVLVGPVTGGDLRRSVTSIGGLQDVVYTEGVGADMKVYRSNGDYVDLIPSPSGFSLSVSDVVESVTQSLNPTQLGRELFRSPYVSFLYERGWRQQFQANGFPGIDKEFEEVLEFFAPAEGGTVLDMSCGSGLMTRRLVSSGRYGRVLAADFSESMLRETARRFREAKLPLPTLVRCDVAKLPMRSESISAVHAGAALHCWPQMEQGVEELCRVLEPSGVMFATTFLTNALIGGQQGSQARGFRLFGVQELETIFKEAGFQEVAVRKEGRACAVVRASKA
eukprot:CAMPEP_0206017090 /NCGR_PEP_ID=MMETSP1464-20131121/24222_1 /ASSEMBLY_ACC=CAM_ASM_001124 /TAXON_ID=119497 /ORGANISM="Exanthemachrysis gayraliae, Strain RCC1523" /LENGTH=324 /DNA_ID=CAMNT_0053390921 /DNA_START=35 /DNA_END=1009 /DNA_ORIENTATION=-